MPSIPRCPTIVYFVVTPRLSTRLTVSVTSTCLDLCFNLRIMLNDLMKLHQNGLWESCNAIAARLLNQVHSKRKKGSLPQPSLHQHPCRIDHWKDMPPRYTCGSSIKANIAAATFLVACWIARSGPDLATESALPKRSAILISNPFVNRYLRRPFQNCQGAAWKQA